MTAEEATAAHREGQSRAAALEPRLRRQYRSVLRQNARSVASKYREKSRVLVGASQGEEPHSTRPTLMEILDANALAASATLRTMATRRRLALLAGTALFPDSPADFYDELLAAQAGRQAERLVAGTRESVATLIGQSLEQGWSVPETAVEIQKALDLDAEWRSVMLARTDLISIGNAASQQAAQALGEDGPRWKTWLTAEDERVRETHADAAGQVVAIDEPFDVGEASLMFPGDPDGPDDEVINCRCSLVYTDASDAVLEHSAEGGIQETALPLAASAAPRAILESEEVEMDDLALEYEVLIAASFTADERKAFAKSGVAMSDGSYPIRNASDLSNAIHAIGRGSGSHAAIRAHIIKRARALGLVKSLPESWNVSASALRADAGGLCDMLDGAIGTAQAALDAAMTLAAAIRGAYEQEEAAEGDMSASNGVIASAGALLVPKTLEFKLTEPPLLGPSGDPLGALGEPGPTGEEDRPFLVAAARGSLPFPRDWFFTEEPDAPMPLTVTADGQVFGHLAEWDRCHTGFGNRCVMARPSPSGYEFFHVGQVITADGESVDVGKITVGTGHASMLASPEQVTEHYDNTGAVAAYVRVTDGEHGPWLAGSIEPDATERQIRDLRANGPSGDWRNLTRRADGLDLLGILSVPKQGFPTPRALMASGEGGDEVVLALFAGGVDCGCDPDPVEEHEPSVVERALAAMPAVR